MPFNDNLTPGLARKLTEVSSELANITQGTTQHTVVQDAQRVTRLAENVSSPFYVGRVLQAFPYIHQYLVQVPGFALPIYAVKVTDTGLSPIGASDYSMFEAGSSVLVYQPIGGAQAFIIGAVPSRVVDARGSVPDMVQQGGNTGFKRDSTHRAAIEKLPKEAGLENCSAQRPLDATPLDRGWVMDTGLALHLDPFQAYLRVNEACGLFLNFLDGYTRLAGMQLDVQTPAMLMTVRNDEGECLQTTEHATYPWEGLGLWRPGLPFVTSNSPAAFQIDKNVGSLDLLEDAKDLQSFYRYTEYGGYHGQGRLRMLAAPQKQDGLRRYSDEADTVGLFTETLALDGEYGLRTAKRLSIGKFLNQPQPKRRKTVEDPTGDTTENYNASSVGSGTPHKVQDVQADNDPLRNVAGLLDRQAYLFNWKALHPFHYHEKDYHTPEQSEAPLLRQAVEHIDFSQLASNEVLSPPEAQTVRVDHRYGDVSYYARESSLTFEEDGSVVLTSGCGVRLVMAGGQARIDAPADIQLVSGKRVVQMGWDLISKAKNSVDISSAERDVRIFAKKNLQVSAGGAEGGGILFDCQSSGKEQDYNEKVGEDVEMSGIVFRCKNGVVSSLAKEMYFRTLSGSGPIVLDANQGQGDIITYSRTTSAYTQKGLDLWFGYQGDEPNPTAVHSFRERQTHLSGSLAVENSIQTSKGTIHASGALLTGSALQEGVAAPTGPEQERQDLVDEGDKRFQEKMLEDWYEENQLGHEDLLKQIGFSFRDPAGDKSTSQYRTENFRFLEPLWMQRVRLGSGSGGEPWKEPGVDYQSIRTYPWPGRKKLLEDKTLEQYQEPTLHAVAAGHDKDRAAEEYQEPKLAELKPVNFNDNMKAIL